MKARSPHYETAWLKDLAQRAREAGTDPDALLRNVVTRLNMGARQYGDDDFMSKDVLGEAIDEASDLVAYALMETHKRNARGGGGHHHLERAALFAVLADHELRLARQHT